MNSIFQFLAWLSLKSFSTHKKFSLIFYLKFIIRLSFILKDVLQKFFSNIQILNVIFLSDKIPVLLLLLSIDNPWISYVVNFCIKTTKRFTRNHIIL